MLLCLYVFRFVLAGTRVLAGSIKAEISLQAHHILWAICSCLQILINVIVSWSWCTNALIKKGLSLRRSHYPRRAFFENVTSLDVVHVRSWVLLLSLQS